MTRESLFADLGGAGALAAAVEELYVRLLADPEVAPYFDGVDVHRVRRHVLDFLVALTEGPDGPEGPDGRDGPAQRELEAAHRGLRITDAAFDATVAHLLDVLEERVVRLALLDSVLDRLAPLRPLVVTAG